jgi:hypothetical protein
MLRYRKDCVMTIKPGHQTTGNVCMIWPDELSYMLFSTLGSVYVWRTSREAYKPGFLIPTVKRGEGSVMVWSAVSWYSVCWSCHQSLIQLAKHNRVQLIWVPGHEGIVGNEMADHLAKTGSEHSLIGPEPACGISIELPRKWSGTGRTEITKNIGNP